MTAMLTAGAASATMSVMGGNTQANGIKKQAEYNAEIYEQQGQMVLEKKKIQDYQFNRQAAQVRGSIVAKTAGKGLNLSGSPLAILIDNETQMQYDKAIQDYNTDIEYNYAKSGATNMREQGVQQSRLAKMTGYTNAFSTILNTGATYGMLNIGASNPLKPSLSPMGARTLSRKGATR